MKKAIYLVLALVLALSLAGCNMENGKIDDDPATTGGLNTGHMTDWLGTDKLKTDNPTNNMTGAPTDNMTGIPTGNMTNAPNGGSSNGGAVR